MVPQHRQHLRADRTFTGRLADALIQVVEYALQILTRQPQCHLTAPVGAPGRVQQRRDALLIAQPHDWYRRARDHIEVQLDHLVLGRQLVAAAG